MMEIEERERHKAEIERFRQLLDDVKIFQCPLCSSSIIGIDGGVVGENWARVVHIGDCKGIKHKLLGVDTINQM